MEGYYVILWLFAASQIFRLDFIIIILYYYVVFNPHVLFVHCSELLRVEQRGHFSNKYNSNSQDTNICITWGTGSLGNPQFIGKKKTLELFLYL